MTIRHLLLDADGVVQTLPDGRRDTAAARLAGDRWPELLEQLYLDEAPALRGEGDFVPVLRETVLRHGVDTDPEAFYRELWNTVEPSAEVLDLVGTLRAAGYAVHLGTNQHRERATYMRTVLGYDDLFDTGCYSCELGAVKPERAFFDRALDLVGAPAREVLFVDDSLRNVEGARAAGIAAEHWDLTRGLPGLLALLAGHGVRVP